MRDVINAIIGYNEAQTESIKMAYTVERFGTLLSINTRGNLKRQLQQKDVAFEWEKFEHKTQWSEDEWKQISEEADRLFEMKHSKESWQSRGKKQFKKGKWLEE
jgi:fructose-1,6-bisphosphatase